MQNNGVRSLVQARLFASTSRLIDVPTLVKRFNRDRGADQSARVFRHAALNDAMIIKHVLRPHETSAFDKPRHVATKTVFPFIGEDLAQGGRYLFVGERGCMTTLLETLGLRAPDEAFHQDERLLQIFDAVPSFDPYLIAERAALDELELPHGLIDLSDGDLLLLRRSVAASLSQIAALALPDGMRAAASERLASAFLNRSDEKQLEPLRTALRMSEGDFREAIFSWKGVLFYQWKLEAINALFSPMVQALSELKPRDGDAETTRVLREKSRAVVSALNVSMVTIAEELMAYNEAVRKLTEDEDARALSDFLKDAGTVFRRVGESASIVNHCIDYWNYGFRGVDPATLKAEQAVDLLTGIAAPLPPMAANPSAWRKVAA